MQTNNFSVFTRGVIGDVTRDVISLVTRDVIGVVARCVTGVVTRDAIDVVTRGVIGVVSRSVIGRSSIYANRLARRTIPFVFPCIVSAITACTQPKDSPAVPSDSAKPVAIASATIAPDTAERTLAIAAGVGGYHVDSDATNVGRITGDVLHEGALPADTTITTLDSTGCRAFEDDAFPNQRRLKTKAAAPSIGNAIVWLVGVTHGPRDEASKRVGVKLHQCQLEPRVQSAPVGATLNTSNYDDYIATLSFDGVGATPVARGLVHFTDPGQVVPSAVMLAKPGLIAIHDAKHAYIRGYIAVAPHPFVAVTEADGAFSFDDVPVGSYQLVVWHERLGARVIPVKVENGATLEVHVQFGATKP